MREILQTVVPVETHRFFEEDGVLVVEPLRRLENSPLDFQMPKFRYDRRPISSVAGALLVQYRFASDPTLTGLAGHIPITTFANLSGPFDITDTPVRRILNRIVAESIFGGMWVAHGVPTPWSVLSYDLPMDGSLSTLRGLGAPYGTGTEQGR
jgi:hypothetical protein